jgi:hypothetical protein
MPTFPEARIGDPVAHGALTVFPLFTESPSPVRYALADEAIAAGSLTVEEVNQAGSVPDLVVENRLDCAVLFLEGEELRGAKQNRVLNASVLVAAASKATIPVSCAEQGRWRYTSRCFASGGTHASYKLRHVLKRSVECSSRAGQGHRSDQGEVWKEVSRQMASLGTPSPTGAMADTYESHRESLVEFRSRLGYVDGAVGLAVAPGARVVSVDLFDKPVTCRKVWDRLLSGFVLDALEAGSAADRPGAAQVRDLLAALHEAPWRPTRPAGIGDEYRARWEDERQASVLAYDGTVLHGSLIAAAA